MQEFSKIRLASIEETIDLIKQQDKTVGNIFYTKFRHKLDAAQSNYKYNISGSYLYVEAVSKVGLGATIRFNNQSNNPLNLIDRRAIKTPFSQFFLTHTAQAGEWIDIAVGFRAENFFEIEDRSDTPQITKLLTDLEAMAKGYHTGYSPTRHTIGSGAAVTIAGGEAASIKVQRYLHAENANTDSIYISQANTVAANLHMEELLPGDSLNLGIYNGPVYAIAKSGTQYLQSTRNVLTGLT